MDMKRILQAFDGASTKPVEGVSDMSKFLRLVTEAEINQVPPMPDVTGLHQELSTQINEGSNPHKVALPVQMAMQHYQQPKAVAPAKESLFKKYFVEAEEQQVQKETERKQLIKQYASIIAERVRLKESTQQVDEIPVKEAPIELTGEPNDPIVHSHEKANPMSLKGRIQQTRAQLQNLAHMAQSDDLLVWQKICELSKGGMFMGLEQNIEQVRHGIQELAKQRKKGGIASRGIDKNISE